MKPDERAIRELHTTWIDAVNAGNLALLLSLMADDVVLLNPGGEPLGRDGFPAIFLGAHQQFFLRCTSHLDEVTVAGDIAYTLCHDTVSVTPRAGGPAAELAGHRITIYLKQPDGCWLLARDAHTVMPVA